MSADYPIMKYWQIDRYVLESRAVIVLINVNINFWVTQTSKYGIILLVL